MTTDDPDHLSIGYEVVSVERCNAGRLIGIATVRLEIAGLEMLVAGIQVRRAEPGHVDIRAPAYRHPATGEWRGVVELPAAVWDAIAAEVVEAVTGRTARLVAG